MAVELSSAFKALADPNRIRVLGLIAEREATVEELADRLRIKPPTVSHHLARLREAGLVTMRAAGTSHLYRLRAEGLAEINQRLAPARLAEAEVETADAADRRILGAYVKQGRLTQIPVGHRKRQVVLRWLLEKFEPGRTYREAEVNAIIEEYHDDTASLRRYLVEFGLLQRPRPGVYRRPAGA